MLKNTEKTTVNRRLTDNDLENAKRLKAIWESKKDSLGLKQVDVSNRLGWRNSSPFSHYMLGRIALNFDACLRLAKVLQVHPADIMPSIDEYLPGSKKKRDS